ncbi:MAG: hypothetical protein WBX25_14620 [Rhodomicrobium sp.]
MPKAPRIRVQAIELFERQVRFTAPFRFGAVAVEEAPQAFVRAVIEVEGGATSTGATAEMMMPKWFDKRPERTPDETVGQLRRSLRLAADAYLSDQSWDTAFGHHARILEEHTSRCAGEDIPRLAAIYGPALIDKAIADGLCRALGINVFTGLNRNVFSIDPSLTPDITANEIETYLQNRKPSTAVAVRHTVGMQDAIGCSDGLVEIAGKTGCRHFKLKLGGNIEFDVKRLAAIGNELDRIEGETKVTLDANEQYGSLALLRDLLTEIERAASLVPIRRRLLYIEQPFPRDQTWDNPLQDYASISFIIDEADDRYDSFPRAMALGYSGVSSKSCKGFYKSLLNGVRAQKASRQSGRAYFLAAEDLTCQAGLAVQQDTALVAFLGITHAERNGHHYGRGFGTAPAAEVAAFLAAHPHLYRKTSDGAELALVDGSLHIASLSYNGFASAVHPIWHELSPIKTVRKASKEIAR